MRMFSHNFLIADNVSQSIILQEKNKKSDKKTRKCNFLPNFCQMENARKTKMHVCVIPPGPQHCFSLATEFERRLAGTCSRPNFVQFFWHFDFFGQKRHILNMMSVMFLTVLFHPDWQDLGVDKSAFLREGLPKNGTGGVSPTIGPFPCFQYWQRCSDSLALPFDDLTGF